jgi:hypothetical protein
VVDYVDIERDVPELSVLYRVRRRLKAEGKNLRRSAEGSSGIAELGRYYVIDAATNSVLERNIDLEALARKVGALRPSETVIRA